MIHKKYIVSYSSGATCYGWTEEHDKIEEIENFIKSVRNDYTARITVFDCIIGKYILYKRALSLKPETDLLEDILRDLRTTTRTIK